MPLRSLLAAACAVSLLSTPLAPAAWADAPAADADPIAVAQAALERGKAALSCRFAFSLQEEAANRALFTDNELRLRQTLEFDPRRAIGERWRVINTTRADTRQQRRQLNVGGRSDPRTDLLTLTLEGDIEITELALLETRPDAWVFRFKPAATSDVPASGQDFLNSLQGRLTVSRLTGQVTERALQVEPAFDAGQGRVRSGEFIRRYAIIEGGLPVVASTEQNMAMTARGQGVRTQGRQTYSGVTPICDPAEVARIDALEAAVRGERSDQDRQPGSRVRN